MVNFTNYFDSRNKITDHLMSRHRFSNWVKVQINSDTEFPKKNIIINYLFDTRESFFNSKPGNYITLMALYVVSAE